MNIKEATIRYQEMVAEATRQYEAKLNEASAYYYREVQKVYQDLSKQVNNLLNSTQG